MTLGSVPPVLGVIRSLESLAPKFRARVTAMILRLVQDGYDPVIAESLRSDARQRYLYGFGRYYDDGRGIVTHSPTGRNSWHFYGLAVDVVSRADQWQASDTFWQAVGLAAAEQGLAWGGNWRKLADKAHVQFGDPMPVSPSQNIVTIYDSGGIVAVWKHVGAYDMDDP